MRDTAAGLAALGRGPDSMLVHMSPREVAGLQHLAMAHGGSLTTNPHTGLPEAGILDNLLPTILGVGLSFMGVPAWAAGLGVGGLQAARTGDIGKGLMAGLGAFGGAGLGGALSASGAGAGAAGTTGSAGAAGFAPAEVARLQAVGFPTTAEGINAANYMAGDVAAGAGGAGAAAKPTFMQALGQQFNTPMSKAAAGIGALGALGGFEQPQFGIAAPQQERSTARLSGPWQEEIDPTAMGSTGRLIYTGNRFRGSYAKGGSTHSVPQLEDGGFVLTKKAVDGIGKGDNEKGQRRAAAGLGAIPIKGPGTGTSDSIPTSIDGKRPALVSNGEAYVPKREVQKRGGAKKFYALMKAAERKAARA